MLRQLKRLRLIDDWRHFWRFASVQAAAMLGVLSLIQANVLPFVQPLVSPEVWPWVVLGFSCLITVVRVIAQQLPTQPPEGGQ